MRASLALVLALAVPLTGCLGFLGDAPGEQVDAAAQRAEAILGERGRSDLVELATRPKNYTLPGTATLPTVTTFFNASVGLESNLAVESQRDDGGIDWNGVVKTLDVTPFVPPGQATEIQIKLWWNAAEGRSADLDIYVKIPGLETSTNAVASEMDWNVPSKTLVVNTVGVPAQAPYLVGVQASNGRTTGDIPFTMQLVFTYEKDALGPGVPYAIQVPANATGLVFESAKAGGAEHVSSQFVVVGPDDRLVSFQDYNDLAIPLEQVYVPVKGGGEYVFYAYTMRGGFLTVAADVAPEEPVLRMLGTAEEVVWDVEAPSPGVPGRSWLAPVADAPTPATGGETKTFSLDTLFPLRVDVVVDASAAAGFTGAVDAQLASPKGVVHAYQRLARLDAPQGTLGYTDEEPPNSVHTFANIDRGAWTIQVINDSNAKVGHRVLTYVR